MERSTISLDQSLAREFDELIAARGCSRAAAMRDLSRGAVESDALHALDHQGERHVYHRTAR